MGRGDRMRGRWRVRDVRCGGARTASEVLRDSRGFKVWRFAPFFLSRLKPRPTRQRQLQKRRQTQKLGAAICVVREGAWVRFFAALPSCVRAGRMTADCSGEGKGKSEWRILLYSANLLR